MVVFSFQREVSWGTGIQLTADLIISEQFYDILAQKWLVLMMDKEEGKWGKREEKNQQSLQEEPPDAFFKPIPWVPTLSS